MYIFLDIDGVLTKEDAPGVETDPDEDLVKFDAACLHAFENVLRRHKQVKIVISSSWREMFSMDTMRSLFSPDVAEQVEGITPIATYPIKYFRYKEIRDYLKQNAALGAPWLAVDSRREHFPPEAYLVATDGYLGFTDREAEELETMLRQLADEAAKNAIAPVLTAPSQAVLGIDWDGVASVYQEPFAFLARFFSRWVVLTANDDVTPARVQEALKLDGERLIVEVCPADKVVDYAVWKAEKCRLHQVDILFDDNHQVVTACRHYGIHAVAVSECQDK